jgi:hypothetical protein
MSQQWSVAHPSHGHSPLTPDSAGCYAEPLLPGSSSYVHSGEAMWSVGLMRSVPR